jgi:hypothetical protein
MRIRIVRPHPGELDGVALHVFQPGSIYEVPAEVATYLITMECAEPVVERGPALAVPLPESVSKARG